MSDPFYWMTQATRTKDEQAAEKGVDPYNPFPRLWYLRLLLGLILGVKEPVKHLYKSRTMMASWLYSAVATWIAGTRPASKIVVQSQDEDRALNVINNCKTLWEQSIPAVRERWPLSKALDKQAYNRLIFANDSGIVGIPGDPRKIKSEHPTIYIMDEAALMIEGEAALNEAAGARCPNIWCLSSAMPGWFADLYESAMPSLWPENTELTSLGLHFDVASTMLDELPTVPPKPASLLHGMETRRTSKGVLFIDLDIEADPQYRNNSEALRKVRALFTSDAHYRREVKREAYSLSGALVYPEFSPEVHVIPHSRIPLSGTLYMALDPHPRTPHAALWVLIDRFSDWYVYRELWPSIIYGQKRRLTDDDPDNVYSIREYCQTMAAMEGAEIEWHNPETDGEYGVWQPKVEKLAVRYMDQAGKGFIANESTHETYARRYLNCGMQFRDPVKSHEAGEDAIRALLKPRTHDLYGMWPRLHISDLCVELILELRNHRYVLMKRTDPEKELKQQAAEFRSHLVDCFDDRTEVLTNSGWMPFRHARDCRDVELATVNLTTDTLEYQRPTEFIERRHTGEMIRFGGHKLDGLVTPNHRMVVTSARGNLQVKLARDLVPSNKIKLHTNWRKQRDSVTVEVGGAYGEAYQLDSIVWAELLGWYVAEGVVEKTIQIPGRGYGVIITQSANGKFDQLEGLLRKTPWRWNRSSVGFYTSCKWLWEFLRRYGTNCADKSAPDWVKTASKGEIDAFIRGAVLGDGWLAPNGGRRYATTSPLLADDMQELFIKSGSSASVITGREAGVPYCIKGRSGSNTREQFWVLEWTSPVGCLRDSEGNPNFGSEAYSGLVYCASVPNGTLVVRRNGKPMIAGNCLRYVATSNAAYYGTLSSRRTDLTQFRLSVPA